MPAPHAFWVIVDGTTPTSFRAKHREDLVPTLTQLQRTQPAVVLRWFDRGQLWESPIAARDALEARRRMRSDRPPTWRPGGGPRRSARAVQADAGSEKSADSRNGAGASRGRRTVGLAAGGPENLEARERGNQEVSTRESRGVGALANRTDREPGNPAAGVLASRSDRELTKPAAGALANRPDLEPASPVVGDARKPGGPGAGKSGGWDDRKPGGPGAGKSGGWGARKPGGLEPASPAAGALENQADPELASQVVGALANRADLEPASPVVGALGNRADLELASQVVGALENQADLELASQVAGALEAPGALAGESLEVGEAGSHRGRAGLSSPVDLDSAGAEDSAAPVNLAVPVDLVDPSAIDDRAHRSFQSEADSRTRAASVMCPTARATRSGGSRRYPRVGGKIGLHRCRVCQAVWRNDLSKRLHHRIQRQTQFAGLSEPSIAPGSGPAVLGAVRVRRRTGDRDGGRQNGITRAVSGLRPKRLIWKRKGPRAVATGGDPRACLGGTTDMK